MCLFYWHTVVRGSVFFYSLSNNRVLEKRGLFSFSLSEPTNLRREDILIIIKRNIFSLMMEHCRCLWSIKYHVLLNILCPSPCVTIRFQNKTSHKYSIIPILCNIWRDNAAYWVPCSKIQMWNVKSVNCQYDEPRVERLPQVLIVYSQCVFIWVLFCQA